MTTKLQAELRNDFTRSAIHRLREENKVPSVVYGTKTAPVALTVEQKDLLKTMHNPNALIALETRGQSPKLVVLHAVQKDPISHTILSVDFHEVDLDAPVKAHVHIDPIPDPEGKTVAYQMFLHELYVECRADQIPSSIGLDLTPLGEGKAILVKNLTVPEGVHVLTRADEVVASPIHGAHSTEVEEAAV